MRDVARDIRNALADPRRLCERLALSHGAKPNAGGLLVLCPNHRERTPSCSVTRGPDGTVRVRCYGCDWTGDALTLVAECRGLDVRTQFPEVLAEAAELAGMHQLASEIRDGKERPEYVPPPAPEPLPDREYPDVGEVRALYRKCLPVSCDNQAVDVLMARRADPGAVTDRRLARVLPIGTSLPRWAAYRGRLWTETGHRLILPCFDSEGHLASVRAWRLTDADTPKRLPPAGHKATGLVLANMPAVELIRGQRSADTVLIVEGEPDYLSVATRRNDPTFGIFSGSWSPAFAERIPVGCDVFIWTHADDAGNRYADKIRETLKDRCAVWRAA